MKKIVVIRFFNWFPPQNPELYKDVGFLNRAFNLLCNNALRTLNNQTDRNFTCILLYDSKLGTQLIDRYRAIVCALKYDFEILFMTRTDYLAYCKQFVKQRIAFSRIDYDDFIHKNAVKLVNDLEFSGEVACHGYKYGFEYLGYFTRLTKAYKNGYWSCFCSILFAENVFTIPEYGWFIVYNHTQHILKLGEKFTVSRCPDEERDRFIWYKHANNMSNFLFGTNYEEDRLRRQKDKVDLAPQMIKDEFGFDPSTEICVT